ncbi:MAG: alpha/beta hydrolase [Alphaproteobacteria bacterium]|nr:alpha/beta hydrolase [Alphaproteobacteria bacterium]
MTTGFAIAGDGIRLAFETAGEASGPPVLLVHGFGSSRGQNWKSTGWYSTLTEAGFAVLAMDCRGHGDSDKPRDPAAYGHDRMAEDVAAVMDAAAIPAAHYCGYSMGGFIGLRFVAAHPHRVLKLALAGVGGHYLDGPRISDPNSRDLLAEALETDDPSGLTDKRAIMFRAFANQPGKDRFALAACMRAMSPRLPPEALAQIAQPVLVVCGENDDIAGPAQTLAAQFRHGSAISVPARDHMTAVGDQKTRRAVAAFFSR